MIMIMGPGQWNVRQLMQEQSQQHTSALINPMRFCVFLHSRSIGRVRLRRVRPMAGVNVFHTLLTVLRRLAFKILGIIHWNGIEPARVFMCRCTLTEGTREKSTLPETSKQQKMKKKLLTIKTLAKAGSNYILCLNVDSRSIHQNSFGSSKIATASLSLNIETFFNRRWWAQNTTHVNSTIYVGNIYFNFVAFFPLALSKFYDHSNKQK